MDKKKADQNFAAIAALFAVGLGFGGGSGYVIGGWMKTTMKQVHVPEWYIILLLPVMMYLGILAHELGHAILGTLQGMEFRFLAVGPLLVERDHAGWRCKYNRSLSTWGGLAACIPNKESMTEVKRLRWLLLWFTLGGPAASLLGTLGLWAGKEWMISQPYLAVALGEFGLMSAMFTLATLVPLRVGGYSSDGRRVLDLLTQNADGERWAALSVLGTMTQLRRTKDWPREAVELATSQLGKNGDSVTAMWMRHLWHDARGERTEAIAWLNRALEARACWPKANQPLLDASAACFYALRQRDKDRAKEFLAEAMKPGMLQREMKLLAQAAVGAIEGDLPQTRLHLEELKPLRDKLPEHNRVDLDEEIAAIEQLIAR